ncbi:GNAT family N-acetyltransferase [Streptomyces sp. H10-C2]|uniref:GNAT family N-acetyltransferase n=1 Tax=unclassified Streptomyces TaxID=2593676 RepID=UPI0024BB1AA8|nr:MULTISPECIES: GNAT family N-acetyltransferase [unclassified Streptomyces]MDJ0344122.1 GNAT family N-acetyltransferase [Streptomyces sp. PH10-H1]MDJ0374878.1 GNAT family N-acetyltransferase [Streptomyces sp. H10-C2]
MDHGEVLALFDRQMRRGARAEPGTRVERDGDVVRQTGADHDWNGVVWSDLDQATANVAIAAQVRYFASLGLGFEWKVYAHDRPGDLGGRLRAAGFTPEAEETLMVARIQDLPTGVELPEGVHLRPVTGPAGVDLVADVHEQAFGTSSGPLRQRLLAQLVQNPETVSMIVAMAGDLPVCAARMELNPGTEFAGLWGGGTVAAWRGRGIYRALVAHRARIAAELGYRYLQVDASDQSRPILQRLGFVPLTTTTPYVHQPQRHDREP